jgi:hypothetical protein
MNGWAALTVCNLQLPSQRWLLAARYDAEL